MTDVAALFPLTPMQAGLLFHSLAEPEPGIYVVQMRFALAGPLDVGALRAAWHATVRRHSVLRTALVWDDIARPVQVVLREVAVPFVEHDLRAAPAGEQPQRIAGVLQADRARGFDLATAPLMRVLLIRLDHQRYELVWSHHHAILDGWSTSLVADGLFERYRGLATGGPSATPEPPPEPMPAEGVTFREYVSWLSRRAEATTDAFWKRELAGYRVPVRLDADRPRTGGAGRWFDRHLDVPPARDRAWREAARRHRVTFSTLVQGAWAALLGRYDSAAPEDVVYGLVTAVRDHERPGGDRVVGLCVTTLPMRVSLARDQPCGAWLQQIQRTQARMAEHDAVDIGRFRDWAEVPPSKALFRYLLAIENYPQGTLAAGTRVAGLDVRYLGVHEATNYAVTAGVPVGDRPRLKLTADGRTVAPADVDRLLAEWARMLDRLADERSATVGELLAPASAPATAVTAAPAGTSADTLLDRFATQVARRPDAPAVTDGDTTLSYAELDARAGRLARRLVALGVRPESPVGLVADRSAELVVGILGILRSGGAYVPLDPGYPAARRGFIARDANVGLVVTDGARDLPELAGYDLVDLAGDGPEAAEPAVTAHQLAYVIYTSGSTGQPKGVLVEHANVVALLDAARRQGHFDERDAWTMCHSYAFDVSVFEMWGALAHGGRLVVVPAGTTRSPDALHALARAERVTVLSQTPSAFRLFAAADARSADGVGDALRLVLFAGEDLGTVSLGRWLDRYSDRRPRLVNLYGITETAVHSTWHEVGRGELSGEQTTSRIGTGLAGWSLRVLDGQLQPVPVGVAGELYVGGAGLARGYAGRPGLTAQRFVPDPTGNGGRLYRSGDRARRLADGTLEYVGRTDAQVKIRGVRVEPGEVESVLTEHPAVAQCVVTARRFGPGDVRLVAFVVAPGAVAPGAVAPGAAAVDAAQTDAELRRYARERLPEVMVPSMFVTVPRLPLTPSGKVDRTALGGVPVPAAAARGTPPRTPTERTVAGVWCAVLGAERVGVDDNFFDIGGHSLLMFGLLQQLRAAGWPELTMVELFANPTVAALSRLLDQPEPADTTVARDGEQRRTRTAALRSRRGSRT